MRNCRNCIWNDKCQPEEDGCEYYDPINPEETEAVIRREYNEALQERVDDYNEIIAENN